MEIKTRRQFLLQTGMATAAVLLTKPFKSFGQLTNYPLARNGVGSSLTILHTANISNANSVFGLNTNFNSLGGYNNNAALIKTILNNSANVLLLDGGNAKISNYEKHLNTIKGLKYDALHFDTTEIAAEEIAFFKEHKLPIVNSKQTPYKIIKKGNIKIGIISISKPTNSFFNTQFSHCNNLALQLKEEGKCNFVICTSGLGYKNKNKIDDLTLAETSTHIDLIIGNDANTMMKKPFITRNKNKQEVFINHIGHSSMVLGKMDIHFDENGNKAGIAFDNLLVGGENNRWKNFTA